LFGEVVTEIFRACDHVRRHFKNFFAPSFTFFRAPSLFDRDRYFTFLGVIRDWRTRLIFLYDWKHALFQRFYDYGIVRTFELRLVDLICQVLVGDIVHYILDSFKHLQSSELIDLFKSSKSYLEGIRTESGSTILLWTISIDTPDTAPGALNLFLRSLWTWRFIA
jgi:hypothetical protein